MINYYLFFSLSPDKHWLCDESRNQCKHVRAGTELLRQSPESDLFSDGKWLLPTVSEIGGVPVSAGAICVDVKHSDCASSDWLRTFVTDWLWRWQKELWLSEAEDAQVSTKSKTLSKCCTEELFKSTAVARKLFKAYLSQKYVATRVYTEGNFMTQREISNQHFPSIFI